MDRPHLLTDEQVIRLVCECADRIREHRGATQEGDATLRAVEWFARAMNEKLTVQVHFRELDGGYAARDLRRIAASRPKLD